MTKNHHEIIICGAGMIGLTFALLMAEKKLKSALLIRMIKTFICTTR